jgi:hypothetical protein
MKAFWICGKQSSLMSVEEAWLLVEGEIESLDH